MSALHIEQRGDVTHLRFTGSLTIAEVTPLRQELLSALAAPPRTGQSVDLDLASVTEADSAGVQLLTATALWLRQQQLSSTVSAPAACVDLVARAIGAADDQQCCGFQRCNETGVTP